MKADEFDKNFDDDDDIQSVLDLFNAKRSTRKDQNMTAKLSAEEKVIVECIESDSAACVDNVENEKTVTRKLRALK